MKKIIVIGSANTDMVVKFERLPLPGETILERFKKNLYHNDDKGSGNFR